MKGSGSREVRDHHTRGCGAGKDRGGPRKWSLSLSLACSTLSCGLPSPLSLVRQPLSAPLSWPLLPPGAPV